MGKTGATGQIVERIAQAGWPVLPFRLDRLDPTQRAAEIGRQLLWAREITRCDPGWIGGRRRLSAGHRATGRSQCSIRSAAGGFRCSRSPGTRSQGARQHASLAGVPRLRFGERRGYETFESKRRLVPPAPSARSITSRSSKSSSALASPGTPHTKPDRATILAPDSLASPKKNLPLAVALASQERQSLLASRRQSRWLTGVS